MPKIKDIKEIKPKAAPKAAPKATKTDKKDDPKYARYLKFIQDKTKSLDDRWKTFIEAPKNWRANRSRLFVFKSEKLLKTGVISWFDDFYVDSYEKIDMIDFINRRLPNYLKSKGDYSKREMDKIINSFKEEILEANLGSCKYAW